MDIKMKFDQFLVKYPVQEKDSIWDEHSSRFRGFWKNRIMASDGVELTTDEMDQVLLILDKSSWRSM